MIYYKKGDKIISGKRLNYLGRTYINPPKALLLKAGYEEYDPEQHLTERQLAIREYKNLITELKKYDYIGVKIATGVATIEEYSEQIAHCEELRARVRELEVVINTADEE